MRLIARAATALGILLAASFLQPVTAQDARRITIVVPYPPGGPTDAAARVVGEHIGATLGQTVVIENISGGGGTMAVIRVTQSPPDGTTLLMHQLALAANATLLKLPFDTGKDLTGVALVNYSPMVLIGRNTLAATSMTELVGWIKQQGANVKFAHAGSGTLAHLCAAIFAHSIGTPITMVPYRGGAPALTDTLAGHTDLYWSAPSTAVEQIRGKLIKAFAVTGTQSMAALPDVPSAVALGYKDLDVQFWQGLFAPVATPKPVIDRLNAAVQLALVDAKVVKSFADTGMTAFGKSELAPETATAKLHSEIKRWAEVIHANKIDAAQ